MPEQTSSISHALRPNMANTAIYDRVEKEKRVIEAEKRAIENENRLLRQLLQANNIPFVGSTHMTLNQPFSAGGMLGGNARSDSNSSVYNSYFDQNEYYNNNNNNLGSRSQSVILGPSPAMTDTSTGHGSTIQGSLSAGPTPGYSPDDPSPVNFSSPPITNGGVSMPPLLNPSIPTQYFDGNGTANDYNQTKGRVKRDPDQLVPHPFFNDPDDPLFIEFVIE